MYEMREMQVRGACDLLHVICGRAKKVALLGYACLSCERVGERDRRAVTPNMLGARFDMPELGSVAKVEWCLCSETGTDAGTMPLDGFCSPFRTLPIQPALTRNKKGSEKSCRKIQ